MRTVGEILKKARAEKNVTLEDIEKVTKIRKKFLFSLEQDDFEGLPGATYAKGFIKNYSDYLGLRAEAMLAIYRRQVDEGSKQGLTGSSFIESRFRITPRIFLIITIVSALVLVLGYIVYEYQAYVGTPRLDITIPVEGEVITNDMVKVSGRTNPESTVSINNQIISTAPDGSFSVEVTLEKGENVLLIDATNAFGKKRTVKRMVRRE